MAGILSGITVRQKPGHDSKGLLTFGNQTVPCALGRGGMGPIKLEGNGVTPILTTRMLYGFYRPDREKRPLSAIPFYPMQTDMGWCDEAEHRCYNRLVSLPFEASHETMWREDPLYDLVVVLDINIAPRAKRRGSAIFMHVAREGYTPTEGCIALDKKDLRHLLGWMSPETKIDIAR
ncbi:L,D-transpeptidase family protein [uncultured Cohaesibacter sp.]|uniref:L,D-transpeptidase family protein n=1 Tax=uncultured Cohaesibacter sp. TaxID=1002546 RepID=UPI002AAB5D4E|nr:L,D-transpeptidase family protein [uncultured Cohaesibacter sp.]